MCMNSPYRGYYRCSSSKGCSARKQVERSCADPTMLIVTYTSEHNHGLPAGKTNSTISLQMEKQSFTPSSPPPPSSCQVEVTEASTTASNREHPRESPFSSIINSAHSADGHGDSSLDLPEEDRLSSKRGADMCFVQRSTIIEEDGVFDDLEELPEMSSMFSGSYLVSAEDGWFT
ncbi:hypothetical protein KP509_09G022800 [Ceratopteris richardii]|uniref:WRKY domain-containing protein n=1 Tax=Ceratopteris richardii TaxID=49495 RepID=A0A8T2U593_CERRI|nr:hypothetical protein KP509_09G022800 [Ceratopteris richardii]